eukprot:gene7625-575_t
MSSSFITVGLSVAVLAFVTLVMDATATKGPSFCHGLDCPPFTVLNKTSQYEVRAYNRTMWARTHIAGQTFDQCQQTGVTLMASDLNLITCTILSTIFGNNVDKQKIAMTTPVLISVRPDQSLEHDVSFMVPFDKQPNPPRPAAANIYLTYDAKHVSYVKSFPGFASGSSVTEAANQLSQALQAENLPFNSTVYYAAIYDGPYKLFDRHNEVWYDAI